MRFSVNASRARLQSRQKMVLPASLLKCISRTLAPSHSHNLPPYVKPFFYLLATRPLYNLPSRTGSPSTWQQLCPCPAMLASQCQMARQGHQGNDARIFPALHSPGGLADLLQKVLGPGATMRVPRPSTTTRFPVTVDALPMPRTSRESRTSWVYWSQSTLKTSSRGMVRLSLRAASAYTDTIEPTDI